MSALLSPERVTPGKPAEGDNLTQPAGLFEFLDGSHIQIQQRLTTLRTLAARIAAEGIGPDERKQAAELVTYFNQEARQHHLDEEKHIFPSLLASHDAEVVQAVQHLMQDHGWLEEDWLEIAPSLEAAAGGYTWFDPNELMHAVEIFESLYHDHILLEESFAYPEARKRMVEADMAGVGKEMARRRALRAARGGA